MARVRIRIAPIVAEVVARASRAGVLRNDVSHPDVPMIHMMLGAVADATRHVEPDLWRRYLAIVLDGLRACPGTPSVLPVAALADDQLDCALQAWRPPGR